MMNARFLGAVLAGWFFSATSNAGDISLVRAAEAKDWKLVDRLLDDSVSVDQVQPDGMTALHWAVFRNYEPAVRRLVEAKADVNAKTRYGVTPLLLACERGNETIVELLLNGGANVQHKLPGGETPLLIASRTGEPGTVRALLKKGADPNETERKGQTALMWAAAAGNADVVDALVEAGADLDVSLKTGFTAMMFAARDGRLDVVKALIAAGVDVSDAMRPTAKGKRVPRKGTSAVTLAVESGHFEMAMYLIKCGADPNDQRSGYAPLHALSWVRKPKRGEEPDGDPPPRGSGNLTSLDFVRAIVDAGADVNLRLKHGKRGKAVLNQRGATPFLMASRTADLPLMALLVELGADPKIPNAEGATPLTAAAGVGVRAVGEEAGTEPEVIEAITFLLDHGNEVNTVDENKETAMHGAAYRNFPRVVEFLAAHGADPTMWNHKNVSGWTPVMIAQGHRPGSFKPSPETVAALKAAMSN